MSCSSQSFDRNRNGTGRDDYHTEESNLREEVNDCFNSLMRQFNLLEFIVRSVTLAVAELPNGLNCSKKQT